MDWVLTDTWIQAASRLDAGDAKRLLGFHKKLLEDPDATRAGLNFEHLQHVCDRRVQSLRIDRDFRAIVWHDATVCVLLYVDHHAPAYRWAEAANVNVTSNADTVAVAISTGARVNADSPDATCGEAGAPGSTVPGMFDCLTTAELLEAGVPDALLGAIRGICHEAELDALTPALNPELCDRLLALYLDGGGEMPRGPDSGAQQPPEAAAAPPSDAVGALPLRDIDVGDFERLLENPTEWWVAFADPTQRKIAEGKFSGAVLVTGGAGTGKTIVAIHRARHLARKGKRVLLTSYNAALCAAIESDLAMLCNESELSMVYVANVDRVAREMCPEDQGELPVPGENPYTRRIRLACEFMARKGVKSPYDAVIVDETQDLDPQRLVLLRALAGKGRDSFMLLGDANQRIYGQPLDLEDLGISVEGRHFLLGATYRTTRDIADFGQRILDGVEAGGADLPSSSDAPVSGVPGPRPTMVDLASPREEAVQVSMGILRELQGGVPPERIAVFSRRRKRLRGVQVALEALGVPCMDVQLGTKAPVVGVRLMTMHQARGLEFRVVFVLGASSDEVPNSTALSEAEGDTQRKDVEQRERSLLHISATRATHELYVSWVGSPSEYLDRCDEAAEVSTGFNVTRCLEVELDTTSLADDPAGFRLGGHDHVAGGRQIARTLDTYLEANEGEWLA